LGSRGSVVELYQRLRQEGVSSIPITDDRMSRFWITIEQGVDFVLSSLASMSGGETFVPKIASMKITDVASALAPGLSHDIIGIRPGEKLHELMISSDDARLTREYGDRFVISPLGHNSATLDAMLGDGRAVDERFNYSSDTNTEWLSADNLQAMLAATALVD
jgi:UDP-N-acetylglucosamine 4,6-dehydratase